MTESQRDAGLGGVGKRTGRQASRVGSRFAVRQAGTRTSASSLTQSAGDAVPTASRSGTPSLRRPAGPSSSLMSSP
ncbi:hypothetical protein ACFWMX_03585 [Streptomyces sp. NPDC058378]|uniref:hypothetical protein n=1 Tax=Streptomyces sp. NPDC058378 TaxID=3346469 RepID=UPI00364DB034